MLAIAARRDLDARLLADELSGSMVEDLMELDVGRSLVRIGNEWNVVRTKPLYKLKSSELRHRLS